MPPPKGIRERWHRPNFAQQVTLLLGALIAPYVALALFLVGAAICGC